MSAGGGGGRGGGRKNRTKQCFETSIYYLRNSLNQYYGSKLPL